MTPTMPTAELIAPLVPLSSRAPLAQKSNLPLPVSGSTENLDALMSVWAAIFQQQLAPEIPPPVDASAFKPTGGGENAVGGLALISTQVTDDKSPTESAKVETVPIEKRSTGGASTVEVPPSRLVGEAPKVEQTEPPPILAAGNLLPTITRTDAAKAAQPVVKGNQPETPVPPVPAPPMVSGVPKPAARSTRMASETPGPASPIVPVQEFSEVTTLSTELHLKRAVPQRQAVRAQSWTTAVEHAEPIQEAEADPAREPEASVILAHGDRNPRTEARKTETVAIEGTPEPVTREQIQVSPQSSKLNDDPSSANHTTLVAATQPRSERTEPASAIPPPPPPPPVTRMAPPPPQVQMGSGIAKTISIRIPFAESSAGEGARHIDLVFENRNNDLTLQFHSPTSEIQQRIEESMPALMDKLQTADWTGKPSAPAVPGGAEPVLELRKRADPLAAPAPSLELNRAITQGGESSQMGSRFDDQTSQRKEQPTQAQPGRNRKKERAWQFEIDSETES